MPEAEVRVSDVKAFKTKSGNTRFVLVDDQGKEYSTFKEQIAAKLPGLEGKRARITYHDGQRSRQFGLDDYKFDRHATDAILFEIEQRIDPALISGGPPEMGTEA